MPSQTGAQEDAALGVTPRAPWRVTAFAVLAGHRLTVALQDGRAGTLDCSRVREPGEHGVFAPLADEHFFAQVRIDLGALTWPNGADLDPCWIYEELGRAELWFVPF